MTATSTKRAPRASKTAAPFVAAQFFTAGVSSHRQDKLEQDIIRACAAKNLDKALFEFTAGYVADGLAKGEEITPEIEKLARIVADAKLSVGPGSKTVPEGKVRRTKEQHKLARAGARKFNRARAKLEVETTSKTGGARQNTGNRKGKETKVPGSATIPLKGKTVKDVASNAVKFRQGWVNFLSANKELVVSDAALALANDITIALNKFATLVGETK